MRRHAQMQLQSRIRFMQRKKKRFIRRAFVLDIQKIF